MRVSPINNNTNFQARFRKTSTLNNLLKNSDKNTLRRFREVVRNAAKVEDEALYVFLESPDELNYAMTKFVTRFSLYRLGDGIKHSCVHFIEKSSHADDYRAGKANPSAGVLEGFLPVLENKFSNHEETKDDIIKSIEENLV
jgi:hypothetical protein